MEKLLYVVIAVLVVAVLACGGGLWLMHTAVNEGNAWKGLAGAVLALIGGVCAILISGSLSAAR